ncbi:MAG: hypothetical protein EOM62_07745 [Bacteroidia bacterium]|nr:hypothetical protein [Bacteroidia bacterium]
MECDNNYERFWNRYFEQINGIDISDCRIVAFHIVGSLDDCAEIKKNGLINLQKVLSENTILSRLLLANHVWFDIENRILHYEDKLININYDDYCGRSDLNKTKKKIELLAHRVYYDYCVNGFMSNDDVFGYGTGIHNRPEFLLRLVDLLPELKPLEDKWFQKSKSYKITFFANIEQLHRFNFELDNNEDPPYEGWSDLSDDQKIKKWMLSHAIERANGNLAESFLYVKDDIDILPTQIISCQEIHEH